MAETQWYYAQDGQERGPVGSDKLRSLAQKGDIKPDDLVWNESMTDWSEARRIKLLRGLFPPEHSVPPMLNVQAEDQSVAARAASKRAPSLPKMNLPHDFSGLAKMFGVPLLMIGLVLVVFARGLDTLGKRGVMRLQAKNATATDQFNDSWDLRRMSVEDRIKDIRDLEDRDEADEKRLEELRTQEADLNKQRTEARTELERGDWRRMKIAARDADRNNTMWAYWRECLFILGSIALTCGLLAVGFHGSGPERLVCLIMLAIITFSLYVGGFAWSGSFGSLL